MSQVEATLKKKEIESKNKLLETEKSLDQLELFLEEINNKSIQSQKKQHQENSHPIYGKLLHDFGYKKVFATEPSKLCNKAVLPVWENQRTMRPERAQAIATAKLNDNRFGYPGK